MIDYGDQVILSTTKRTTEVLFISYNLFITRACIYVFSTILLLGKQKYKVIFFRLPTLRYLITVEYK